MIVSWTNGKFRVAVRPHGREWGNNNGLTRKLLRDLVLRRADPDFRLSNCFCIEKGART
jgi:hypothetical protein